MEFDSMGALALHLATAAVTEVVALEHGLEKCLKHLEEVAKGEIGHYQSAIGPFPAWADLADSTEAQKAAKGYPADAPLEASGAMRETFRHERHGLEGVMGSTDKKMVWHEFGTPKMPARPVVGTSVLRSREFIRRTIGVAMIEGMFSGIRIHHSLGYDSSQ